MRLIDADVFLKNCLCHLEIMVGRGNGKTIIGAARQIAKEIMKETVEKMPTVEAKPVVHAYWEYLGVSDGKKIYKCTNCEAHIYGTGNFCKECGAQMDEALKDAEI